MKGSKSEGFLIYLEPGYGNELLQLSENLVY